MLGKCYGSFLSRPDFILPSLKLIHTSVHCSSTGQHCGFGVCSFPTENQKALQIAVCFLALLRIARQRNSPGRQQVEGSPSYGDLTTALPLCDGGQLSRSVGSVRGF